MISRSTNEIIRIKDIRDRRYEFFTHDFLSSLFKKKKKNDT